MPKIYEYLGIIIRFFSNEHLPMHIHAFYGDTQIKIEFFVTEGKVSEVKYKKVKGYEVLPDSQMKKLEKFIKKYQNNILQKWIDYFILHKTITCEKITKKIMKVKSVKYINGYKLKVSFDNEETKIIDLKNFLQKARNPMSTKYKNIILFQNVEIDTGFLSWNKGEMEISAESLYFNRI